MTRKGGFNQKSREEEGSCPPVKTRLKRSRPARKLNQKSNQKKKRGREGGRLKLLEEAKP